MKKTGIFHELSQGKVKATIWHETIGGETHFNVAFTRLFNNGERWWDAACFHKEDMPALGRLAEDVHLWLSLQAKAMPQAGAEDGTEGTS